MESADTSSSCDEDSEPPEADSAFRTAASDEAADGAEDCSLDASVPSAVTAADSLLSAFGTSSFATVLVSPKVTAASDACLCSRSGSGSPDIPGIVISAESPRVCDASAGTSAASVIARAVIRRSEDLESGFRGAKLVCVCVCCPETHGNCEGILLG